MQGRGPSSLSDPTRGTISSPLVSGGRNASNVIGSSDGICFPKIRGLAEQRPYTFVGFIGAGGFPPREAGSLVEFSLNGINWIAVIVAGIVAWVIGAVWYSPPVFGKRWMALLGMKVEGGMPEGAGKALAGGLVLAIFTSLILVLFVYGLKAVGLVEGAEVGFLVWLGFVLTHGVTNVMFERRPPALFGITQTELLITYVVMGIILAVWR